MHQKILQMARTEALTLTREDIDNHHNVITCLPHGKTWYLDLFSFFLNCLITSVDPLQENICE